MQRLTQEPKSWLSQQKEDNIQWSFKQITKETLLEEAESMLSLWMGCQLKLAEILWLELTIPAWTLLMKHSLIINTLQIVATQTLLSETFLTQRQTLRLDSTIQQLSKIPTWIVEGSRCPLLPTRTTYFQKRSLRRTWISPPSNSNKYSLPKVATISRSSPYT